MVDDNASIQVPATITSGHLESTSMETIDENGTYGAGLSNAW